MNETATVTEVTQCDWSMCGVSIQQFHGQRYKRFCSLSCNKKQWWSDNPDRRKRKRSAPSYRKYDLWKRYRITTEDYDRMLTAQDGRCAICRTEDPGAGRDHFAVDHNHTTGAVRGLLCNNCNRGIGALQDDSEILRRAADYLEAYSVR